MKTVLLLRHAKSDWDAEYEDDFDRPLARRGRKAAKKIGRFITSNNLVPDLVLASPAVRARTTLEIVMQAGAWEAPVQWNESFYLADPDVVVDAIGKLTDPGACVLLVGHEPTCSALLSGLVGGGAVRYPTAALACVDFDVAEWSEIRYGKGILQWLIPPRLL